MQSGRGEAAAAATATVFGFHFVKNTVCVVSPSCELEKVSHFTSSSTSSSAARPSCVLSYFKLPAIVSCSRLCSSSVRPALVLFTASAVFPPAPSGPPGLRHPVVATRLCLFFTLHQCERRKNTTERIYFFLVSSEYLKRVD